MKTTLNAIRARRPCRDGWEKLLRHLGKTQADDEPLHLRTILDSNGLDHALWCLRAVEGNTRVIRLYAVWCARQVQHLMTDARSLVAIDAAERYANGEATYEYLTVAAMAATFVPWSAAGNTALAATSATAWDAARAAAGTTSLATTSTAWDAARVAQEIEFRRVLDCIDAGQDPYPTQGEAK